MKVVENYDAFEKSLADKSHRIHLYFFHQTGCMLCKGFKKNFFPKLVKKNEGKAVFASVNSDDPKTRAYLSSVNTESIVGFPFWIYYDSESQKVLQAGPCGNKGGISDDFDKFVNST